MLVSPGNFNDAMKIHQPFLQKLGVLLDDGAGDPRRRIQFAIEQGYIQLRRRVADDKLRLLKAENEGEKAAGQINRMADGLSADSQARMSTQFFHTTQAKFSIGEKHIMRFAVRRAEIDELVEVVLNSGLAQNRRRHHATRCTADNQAICTRAAIKIVRGLGASGARHKFDHDRWISGDMLL